ncbi:MAG: Gfo/Idh/MocA family oxidoreductase [Caldilineaceae bacterium]
MNSIELLSNNPVRLVLIGTGLIGQKHATLVSAHDDCSLVGICDVDPARRAVAEQHNVPFFQEIDELLDATKPDGAIIATPNGLHAQAARVCAAHSVPMLIEKPIADTVENAQQIIRLAAAAGVQVLVGHHRRHNPLVQAACAIVQRGDIGTLVGVSVLWMLQKPDDYFNVAWRRERPGGGPALINLIHDIDNLRYICGEIRQVYAQSSSAVRGLAVEDALSVNLRFANGALGTILVADTTPAPWSYELTTGENPAYPQIDENCYHFCGTAGALAFPQMTLWRYPHAAQSGWLHPLAKTNYPIAPTDPLLAQLIHFCRVVRGVDEPFVSGRDAAQSLAAVLAILASAQSGQAITL